MIGLGSNRLSVCRRGGMSVTQAGKGGMEWLAGGRMPDWITPYSAQATAALNAQFSAEQWAIIKAYGFAHPEIVGYMNAYAPEDAKIAYSLVEGIGVRYMKGDGNAYIDANYVNTNSSKYVARFIFEEQTSGGYHGSIFGEGQSWNTADTVTVTLAGSKMFVVIGSTYVISYDMTVGHYYEVVCDTTICKVTDLTTGSVTTASAGTSTVTLNSRKVYVFTSNNGDVDFRKKTKQPIASFEVSDGMNGRKMYPFIRKINGVDVCGMIDVLSGTFYQNAGSGSFTISETPAS